MKAFLRSFRPTRASEPVGVKPVHYYDQAFSRPEWREHYTKSSYYFLWTVVVDRLLRGQERPKVIELGCGPGQLASFIRDKGIRHYIGVDFSATAISLARKACPDFTFACADLTTDPILDHADYDCAVTLEFLEHVEADLEILKRIRPGTRILATVPDFPYVSHVRHFTSADHVVARYQDAICDLRVDAFPNSQGKTFYLLEGVTRASAS